MTKRMGAVAMAVVLATVGTLAQQPPVQQGQISGTAKDQAKEPYPDNSVLVRDVMNKGVVVGSSTLDTTGAFTIPNLPPANYMVELLNKNGKVICTEGPFDLASQLIRDGVIIDCNKVPIALWLLGAGAAAGVTAGVVAATGDASPSR